VLDVSVAVNISASALADSTFPSMVQQALATWGVPPSRLTLELTESSIVENERIALAFIEEPAGDDGVQARHRRLRHRLLVRSLPSGGFPCMN
jgi:hypothetical protein